MASPTTDYKLRSLLAGVLERPTDEIVGLPADTPLLGAGLALDSLIGMQLLQAVQDEFGVDVAAEDLNLDSLETIGTLADFLDDHAPGAAST